MVASTALLLDNMLFMVIVPIISSILKDGDPDGGWDEEKITQKDIQETFLLIFAFLSEPES